MKRNHARRIGISRHCTLLVQPLEDRTVPSGGLDNSFSGSGLQTTDFGFDDRATGVAVQDDGKIVVVGHDDGSLPDFAVARYEANGNLDVSFNTTGTPTSYNGNGKLSFTFGAGTHGGDEYATAVALQANGKIVVAGYSDAGGTEDFAVARITTTGQLDNSFSFDGKRLIDFGASERATAIAIQPDGKIVLAGYVSLLGSDFAVVRLTSLGALDNTFSGDGISSFTIGPPFGEDRATGVAIQDDGKIVVVGYTDGSGVGANDFAVARLTAAGELDTTFSGNGRHTIDFGFDDRATSVAIQRDGKIVIGGYDDGGLPDFAVARLNSSGTLDSTFNHTSTPTSFNGNGRLSFTFGSGTHGGDEMANALVIQPGGKIILAGWTDANGGGTNNFAIARINPNGTFDKAFSSDGKAVYGFGGNDAANAVALQRDGNVVVAGFTDATGVGANDFAVARLIGPNARFVAVGGAPGRVEIFKRDGNLLGSFSPYVGYTGGVSVALGDINSDGYDDLITGAVTGNPHTKVYSGTTMENGTFFNDPEGHVLTQGFPYLVDFNVGANVAAGDVNADGYAEVITGAAPGNPHVRIFDGKAIVTSKVIPTGTDASVLAEGFPYAINFNVGANVAAGDVTGDGYADIVTGATAGNPHTKVYSGFQLLFYQVIPTEDHVSELAQFFPYALQFNVGAFVSTGDYDRDGHTDILTGASIGNPEVRVYNGKDLARGTFDLGTSLLDFYFAFELDQNIGVSVTGADFTADGKADILVGTRNGAPRHRIFKSNHPSSATLLPGFDVDGIGFDGPLYVAA
jgi:uncharacterized delta-60 repeat protein